MTHWRNFPYRCARCGGCSKRPLCSVCGKHEYYKPRPHPCRQCGKIIKGNGRRCWTCAGYKYGHRRRCVACCQRWGMLRSTYCAVCRAWLKTLAHLNEGLGQHCPDTWKPIVAARLARYRERAEQGLPLFEETTTPRAG